MSDDQAVLDLAHQYLRSIYEGDTTGLREVFHPGARVEDMVTGSFRSRTAEQYIQAVASRQSPAAAGEPFAMKPLAVEVLGDMATVTAELRFLGNHFYNVLSLLRCEGGWLIVHKLFGPAG
ncbi:nuclear transport factor 2 family protein [Dyella soli]|uniref:Nuclear transport factor 2 family protein n=1 Tax=Dyella soli TaxID=522319 RepID=A0A4R0YGQ8_9GAMM|nr:nuclear transport factor 2 family protein [Dyella soli]TCI07373.1 nuclear transport factor 2 family protein [Dyella soli]